MEQLRNSTGSSPVYPYPAAAAKTANAANLKLINDVDTAVEELLGLETKPEPAAEPAVKPKYIYRDGIKVWKGIAVFSLAASWLLQHLKSKLLG